MAILARMRSRLPPILLAAVLGAGFAGCGPFDPVSTPAPTQIQSVAPTAAAVACQGVTLPAEAPVTPAHAWGDRVFYELFVRSFADSDGDGVGDFAGATAKLDYLKGLGITGIWLMPVAEAKSYHGYDVTDYDAVEQDYGDIAAFKAFVEAAHARGIYVITDFVLNHTSIDHPWFQDALKGGPHRDWYIWSDTDPGWPAVAGPNPWHRTAAGDYYYGAFWEGMPDLNLQNPEVRTEILRIANEWLDDDGVDGFRLDAAKHLIEVDGDHQANTPETLAWLADFTTDVHASHPEAMILSEVYDIAKTSASYVPKSSDLTFDFGLAAATVSALQSGRAAPIATALGETVKYWPPNGEASFLTNHDQNRLMSQLGGDVAVARLAAAMLMTSPGVPFIYYGEEIGMRGVKPDERIRTPMQWSADRPSGGFSTGASWEGLSDDWQTVNVAAQDGDPTSVLSGYRDAIALRSANGALQEGQTFLVDGGAESVVGWLRAMKDQIVLTVVNVGTKPVSDYALSLGAGPLCDVAFVTLITAFGDPNAPSVGAIPEGTAKGGLRGYVPIATLAPRSAYVLALATHP